MSIECYSDGRFTATFGSSSGSRVATFGFIVTLLLVLVVVQQQQVLLLQVDRLVQKSWRLVMVLLFTFALQQPLTQFPPRGHRATAPDPQGTGQPHHQRHEDLEHEHFHRRTAHSLLLALFQQPRIPAEVLVPVAKHLIVIRHIFLPKN